jgi:hypothetical protein
MSVFGNYGVEIILKEDDDFLKVKETLTRIGIASRKDKILYQSCHILHKQGCYAIVHFKELFALDGKPTDFGTDDQGRRNTIANLLDDWGLLELAEPDKSAQPVALLSAMKILPFAEKKNWELKTKYNIGRKY